MYYEYFLYFSILNQSASVYLPLFVTIAGRVQIHTYLGSYPFTFFYLESFSVMAGISCRRNLTEATFH